MTLKHAPANLFHSLHGQHTYIHTHSLHRARIDLIGNPISAVFDEFDFQLAYLRFSSVNFARNSQKVACLDSKSSFNSQFAFVPTG